MERKVDEVTDGAREAAGAKEGAREAASVVEVTEEKADAVRTGTDGRTEEFEGVDLVGTRGRAGRVIVKLGARVTPFPLAVQATDLSKGLRWPCFFGFGQATLDGLVWLTVGQFGFLIFNVLLSC
ncbi:hypothetical protein BDN72DRAFT_866121 [Pluteus cervinus]|uniref:Uncharacterized protein n=1 Tax=Pluteus cervinus TaxID=181527 RepID=A0ACD2ZY61_9AGAR|nr:hypothetical protein BDN72DRAFT_866121 [Pluteus cervinus]